MELRFEHTGIPGWRERFCREEKIRVDLEGVVPDVNEDVGRIASVQASVLLKSKELTGRSARIGGEVTAAVLYITEKEDAVSFVRLSREFETEIDIGAAESIDELQVMLRVNRAEARILNPRKLAVSAELVCRALGYGREELTLSLLPAEEDTALLHGLEERLETTAAVSVCEKSFALSESFEFPEGRAAPQTLLCHELQLRITDQSRVGSRLIVKGGMELCVWVQAEGLCYPVRQQFSAPFSQIIETGTEACACCTLLCEPTAVYLTLGDGIGGGKTLDAEVHAVLQAVCRSRKELRFLSDAYSNAMPLRCGEQSLYRESAGEMQLSALRASTPVTVAENCADVLAALPVLQVGAEDAAVNLDVIYRTTDGAMTAVRRSVALRGEKLPSDARLLSAALRRCDLRAAGEGMDCELEAELCWQSLKAAQQPAIGSASLDEDHPYDRSALPAVTLVRVEKESLWELARRFHASVEGITAANAPGEIAGRMLLIPRE